MTTLMARAEQVRLEYRARQMLRDAALRKMRDAIQPLRLTDAGIADLLDDTLPLDRPRHSSRGGAR